ncbi:hypothetical protein DUI87_02745 [Hirundo rustica rustica]|uniref:Uncharacterized protein n=1 Tax=Hirundo rustica rustica TaxID=333673 RepID=A0A3M0LD25_HIRRU|nr:hypothetical protein DUI87_02745 [Hirundo rustica rustica]
MGADPSKIVLPGQLEDFDWRFANSISLQSALENFSGKIAYLLPNHKVLHVAKLTEISLRPKISQEPVQGPTIFTDSLGRTGKAIVTWRDGSEWQLLEGHEDGSAQLVELRAAVMAFQRFSQEPFNLVTDSTYVVDMAQHLGHSVLKEVSNAALFHLLKTLWCAIQARVHSYYILHASDETHQPRAKVRVRNLDSKQWEGPYDLIASVRGYVCVSTDTGVRWVPAKCVRPDLRPERENPADRQAGDRDQNESHQVDKPSSDDSDADDMSDHSDALILLESRDSVSISLCPRATHQNNEQVDQAVKIEVSKIDLDWQHKGELFLARWAHDATGHQGRDATYKWAQDRGVDLTMDSISQVIHDCETCAAIKQAKRVKPLWYGGRWSKYKYEEAWQIDYITFPQTRQGKRDVLTMVEATTGWLKTYHVPHATARNTILGLEKQILWRHGTPERIESDNGTHLKNSLINPCPGLGTNLGENP